MTDRAIEIKQGNHSYLIPLENISSVYGYCFEEGENYHVTIKMLNGEKYDFRQDSIEAHNNFYSKIRMAYGFNHEEIEEDEEENNTVRRLDI